MEHLDGPSSSKGETCPSTSQHDFGLPGAYSSYDTSDTKRDVPGSTTSESADSRSQKGSNLSRSSFSKEQAVMSRASQEGSRRGEAPAELDNSEADAGHQTRNLVLSEAEIFTEWYQAIERKDCKTLMTLLRQKGGSALLLKTGKVGRTVLHVAAIQGSLELVDTIRGFLVSAAFDDHFLIDLTRAIDGRCKMTAEEIVSDIIGYSKEWKKFVFEDLMSGKEAYTPDLELSAEWQSHYELTRDDIKSIEQVITCVWNEGTAEGRYEGLMDSFEQNVDYNFVRDEICGNLFLFHHACSRVDGWLFVNDVRKHCREGGDEGLDKLMQLRDFQGRTPLHVAVSVAPDKGRDKVLGYFVKYIHFDYEEFHLRDGRGWTLFHLAASQPHSVAFGWFFRGKPDGWNLGITSADAIKTKEDWTALHLAVLHNNIELLKMIKGIYWEYYGNWRDSISRRIIYKKSDIIDGLSVLGLALLLGNEDIVDALLSREDDRKNEWIERPSELPIICLAAATCNTEILGQVLNDVRFDPFERDGRGRTGLHYVVAELIHPRVGYRTSSSKTIPCIQAYPYVYGRLVPNVVWLDEIHESSPDEGQVNKGYSGRKGCINMLLQAGLDIWQKDIDDKIASPGREINDDEFISWWHEKMAKEALDLRNNLNQGGNAISVIGALIATASYVGPLQPPLSYGSDPSMQLPPTSDNTGYAHVWDPYVKIFMVSNSLSFYLAIASIMLAVVPSLPMPQEALLNELGRTRRTVASAICILLLSVVGILVSYATASIAIMPNHTSLINARWTSYPALVGGFTCLIGIVLFVHRVTRLMCPEMCRRFRKVWERTFVKVLYMVWKKIPVILYILLVVIPVMVIITMVMVIITVWVSCFRWCGRRTKLWGSNLSIISE